MKKGNLKTGFTLIELLVAMAIFSVVVVTVSGIFLSGLGGVRRVFGSQAVQESGRFILESMAKEIRMSKLNSLGGVAFASLPNGVSGPYASLNITNPNSQTVDYVFDADDKQVSRAGEALNPDDVEVAGRFYLTKMDALQPRVTISFGLVNKSDQTKERSTINLQTSVSSRDYAEGAGEIIIPENAPTDLVLTHSTRSKTFYVSWTAGSGNGGAGGCKLQFNSGGSSWTDITSASSVNCDASVSGAAYELNASGWKDNWGGTHIRLVRKSDLSVMGTLQGALACNPTSGSSSPTPTIDEDCDGYWDNYDCSAMYVYWQAYVYTQPGCDPGYFWTNPVMDPITQAACSAMVCTTGQQPYPYYWETCVPYGSYCIGYEYH